LNRLFTGSMVEWARNAEPFAFLILMKLFVHADENGVLSETNHVKVGKLCGSSAATARRVLKRLEEDRIIASTTGRGIRSFTIQIIDFDRALDKAPERSLLPQPERPLAQAKGLPDNNIDVATHQPKVQTPPPSPPVQIESLLQMEFGLDVVRIQKITRHFNVPYIVSAIAKIRQAVVTNPSASQEERVKWLWNILYGEEGRPVAEQEAPAPPPGPPPQVQQPEPPPPASESNPSEPGFNIMALLQKIDLGEFITPAEFELVPRDIRENMRFDQLYWDKHKEYRYFLPKGQ